MKCYACGSELTNANKTEEHVIINAAGGRLKSKNLICRTCNSAFGESIDNALANQLNGLTNILMVKRQRGQAQPIIGEKQSTGERYKLNFGGKPEMIKPKINKESSEKEVNYTIAARDEKEMKQILTGLSKKHPSLDVDEAMKSARKKEEYFNEALHFEIQIGGAAERRAVCKTAINFFILNQGSPEYIQHLIPYIKGEEEIDVVRIHYPDYTSPIREDECCHILQLVGSPEEEILYCYVDFFNAYSYIVLLNNEYSGPNINETYVLDLIESKSVSKTVKLALNGESLRNIFQKEEVLPVDRVEEAIKSRLKLGRQRQEEYQRDMLLEQAIQNTLGKYPEGVPITQEMIDEVSLEIAKAMLPFLSKGGSTDDNTD